MKILFLHGGQSTPGGLKPTYLRSHGHTVLNPALPDDDFDEAVRIAQAAFDRGEPDVVVGSSRGGAVAMNINSGTTPLVLLCPAWKRWGTATTVKPGTVILHARADEIVPFADSEELVKNSGLPPGSLVEVGVEHRLADGESLAKMLEAWEWQAVQEAMERKALLETLEGVRSTARISLPVVHEAGVPRRFGIGALLLIATMYAVLFAILRALRFSPWHFGLVALFFTAVGLGQMLLFKGQHPRRASMLAGIGFCLALFLGFAAYRVVTTGRPSLNDSGLWLGIFCSVLAGAYLGYVAGALIAGVFLVADKLRSFLRTCLKTV